jgi:magnesium transporter
LTSFHTNEVMRVLTIIATIMLPLTLVASILGMNIYPMPVESPAAFAGLMVVMVVIMVAMLTFFRSRRWI